MARVSAVEVEAVRGALNPRGSDRARVARAKDAVAFARNAGWSDERVADRAADEFREIHGVSAEPVVVARRSLPAYDGTWEGLSDLDLPPGVSLLANYLGRLGISARIAQAEAWAESASSEVGA